MNTVKIDPKNNWLKLPILSLIVVSNTHSHSTVSYYSIDCISRWNACNTVLLNNSVPISTPQEYQFSIQSLLIKMDISIQYTIEQWNPFSFASTLFMLIQYNDFMRLSSTIQFIHLIVFIQSLPIYRMIKYSTFLFWTLNQTRFGQFGSSISHKFLIFILNIDHIKDWNMLAKPIWVVMMETSQSMIGS